MLRLILALLLMLIGGVAHAATDVHLLYRGAQPGVIPPAASDQHGRAFKIRGLSGITYAGGSTFWAVMDNSDKLVRLEVSFRDDCSIRAVKVAGGITLSERHDYEGIAGAYVSDEDTPAVRRLDVTSGRVTDTLPLPRAYKQIHRNQGLESLTISPDGKTLWTANERALLIDGNLKAPAEPFGATTPVRLQRFDLSVNPVRAAEQYVYRTSGVHQFGGQIGLCDLVALPDGKLLALERSAAEALGGKRSIRTRIFLVDVAGASDVSGGAFEDGLKEKPITPVSKTLLYDGFVFDEDGENVEGLCLGPGVSPGRYIVVGVVDDGDGIGVSKSRLIAFELLIPQS